MLMSACGKELKIEVSNEDGSAILNADIKVNYVDGGELKIVKGATNEKGVFISQGEKVAHRVELFVSKEGYYTSKFRHKYGNALPNTGEGIFKLILRKKGKMTPLYAKRVHLLLPSLGKKYGFDFEKGDWVTPHGKGVVADMFFHAEKKVTDMSNYRAVLTCEFANENSGIAIDPTWIPGSLYQQVKIADTKETFLSRLSIIREQVGFRESTNTPLHNYVFRTRTKIDKGDKLESANYGRILGGIDALPATAEPGVFAVNFMYFYNPEPNDPNLEFDRKLNLFKKLTREEHIPESTPAMRSRK